MRDQVLDDECGGHLRARLVIHRSMGLWKWLFGCRHRELSRAFTNAGETYKVCLKCGAHLPYSWETMTVVDGKKKRGKPASGAPK